jgi:hypothetical protein
MTVIILTLFFINISVILTDAFNTPSFGRRMIASGKSTVGSLEMKGKGKRVPIDQRGEFIKQQRMLEVKTQMEKEMPAPLSLEAQVIPTYIKTA